MRILVVDDEEPLRRMMRLTLEVEGHEVGEAGDGPHALEAWRRQGPWDAVLLDQRMPGMDGLETLRQLRAGDPGACVIMVTAYASVELAVDAMKLGATDFVRKPMTPDTVRGAVAAALAKKAERPRVPVAGRPPIEAVTMNGFRIVRRPASGGEHRFLVRRYPQGPERDVSVSIHPQALDRVQRFARAPLGAESGFWAIQAERLLADHLWREGALPPSGRLEVADVSRDDLEVASSWKDE
jgi:CheY-like chemotaxis protein